jgi:hypothetical protein
MGESLELVAYRAGLGVSESISARQLDAAVLPLNLLIDDRLNELPTWHQLEPDYWQSQYDRGHFLLGAAREQAIGYGTAGLVLVGLSEHRNSDKLAVSLDSFRCGLINGGTSRRVVKALMSREIGHSIERNYLSGASEDHVKAALLDEVASSLGILAWRDIADIAIARYLYNRKQVKVINAMPPILNNHDSAKIDATKTVTD